MASPAIPPNIPAKIPAKILVVEDDEPVASMLCFLLEEAGYGCIQTDSAEDAWTEVLTQLPSAAVVDLRLPGKDGWWLLRRVRAGLRTHRLPIVLITGFLDDQVVSRAAEFGCECLGKPFSFDDLAKKLQLASRRAAALPAWSPSSVSEP
jgi:two-component system phosphate regulon response regulator PhoB